jgi:hypothetical protein
LELMDVFNDPTGTIFSFFYACGAHRRLLGGGCTVVVRLLWCGATRVWCCKGRGVGEGGGRWGLDVKDKNI